MQTILLKDLPFEINQKFKSLRRIASESRQLERTATIEAFQLGQMLARQKRTLRHGNWAKWCADNLEFSLDTAQRLMKIGSDPRIAESIESFNSVKEIYLALGIMKPAKPEPQRLTGATVNVYDEIFAQFKSGVNKIGTLLADAPVTQWPQETVDAAKQTLEPLVRSLWPDALPVVAQQS